MYDLGVAKVEFVDNRTALQMQGYADPSQETTSGISGIYSRAFVIRAPTSGGFNVIVVADIWACTGLLKESVLQELEPHKIPELSAENLMISGTHTHAAPGQYSGSKIYNSPTKNLQREHGLNRNTLNLYARGIASSIRKHMIGWRQASFMSIKGLWKGAGSSAR